MQENCGQMNNKETSEVWLKLANLKLLTEWLIVSLEMRIYKNKENNLTTSTNGKFVKKAVFMHHLHWVYSRMSFLLEKSSYLQRPRVGLNHQPFG